MEILIGLFLVACVLAAIFFVLANAVSFCEDIYMFLFIDSGLIQFVVENYFALSGGLCFVLAVFYLIYFKPHQAEKYFRQYKANRISQEQAIVKIAGTLYQPAIGIPGAINSKLMDKRINALRKRIRAEKAFIGDLKSYIRTKER